MTSFDKSAPIPSTLRLYMFLLGCKPAGRHTEQHDVFFGIATKPQYLIPDIRAFWPEAMGKIHVDAWREVTLVDGYQITVIPRPHGNASTEGPRLFFINLGGYREGLFEEPHYKVLSVQNSKADATANAKSTAFYQQFQFPGANSHIDDKYGIDVDDLYDIEEILAPHYKEQYTFRITPATPQAGDDPFHLGYQKLDTWK